LPGQAKTSAEDEDDLLKNAVVGYGRIIRDDEGNVIDIILPEDEAGQDAEDQEVHEEEEEEEPRVVEAKTEVVRCTSYCPD
jgi:nucleolar protein 16